jgi:hypothetical protein
MRVLTIVIPVTIALVSASIEYQLHYGGKPLLARTRSGMFSSKYGAAYVGSLTIPQETPIGSIEPGEHLALIWDEFGKDFWACYVRNSKGQRGWVLCGSTDITM